MIVLMIFMKGVLKTETTDEWRLEKKEDSLTTLGCLV